MCLTPCVCPPRCCCVSPVTRPSWSTSNTTVPHLPSHTSKVRLLAKDKYTQLRISSWHEARGMPLHTYNMGSHTPMTLHVSCVYFFEPDLRRVWDAEGVSMSVWSGVCIFQVIWINAIIGKTNQNTVKCIFTKILVILFSRKSKSLW